MKTLVGKFLVNQCNFAKFAKIFHHQNFALYGSSDFKKICANIAKDHLQYLVSTTS